jgi:hypothetical protein
MSPVCLPPVTTINGATRSWYSVAAWSSLALNTGDGRPLYCAAPSTTIACERRVSS